MHLHVGLLGRQIKDLAMKRFTCLGSTFSHLCSHGQIFTSFIYLLTSGSNTKVGYITGIGGLAQVLAAPFFGYLADRFSRDKLLW
jgi:MFS family permease